MSANQHEISRRRMRELIKQLNEADVAYYRDNRPVITDREYDVMLVGSWTGIFTALGRRLRRLSRIALTLRSFLTLEKPCMTIFTLGMRTRRKQNSGTRCSIKSDLYKDNRTRRYPDVGR